MPVLFMIELSLIDYLKNIVCLSLLKEGLNQLLKISDPVRAPN